MRPGTGLYLNSQSAISRRNNRVRRMIGQLRPHMPWLRDTDLPLLRSWVEHEVLGSALYNRLADQGVVDEQGKPREALLNHWRLCRQTQVRLAHELGLTPGSVQQFRHEGSAELLSDAEAEAIIGSKAENGSAGDSEPAAAMFDGEADGE